MQGWVQQQNYAGGNTSAAMKSPPTPATLLCSQPSPFLDEKDERKKPHPTHLKDKKRAWDIQIFIQKPSYFAQLRYMRTAYFWKPTKYAKVLNGED